MEARDSRNLKYINVVHRCNVEPMQIQISLRTRNHSRSESDYDDYDDTAAEERVVAVAAAAFHSGRWPKTFVP